MEEPLDAWKLDFEFFRTETRKRGLTVTYNQAADFARHVAMLCLDGEMDVDKARMHAFNRVLFNQAAPVMESTFLQLFIQNIPEDTHANEIRNFIGLALKPGLFFRIGKIEKVEILIIRDKRTNSLEYHGLAHIDAKLANLPAILEILRTKRLKRKIVAVRQFRQRFRGNDKRRPDSQSPLNFAEKRIGERRRLDNIEILLNIPNAITWNHDFGN